MRRKLCSTLEVEVLETWQILEGGQEKFSLYVQSLNRGDLLEIIRLAKHLQK